MLMWIQKGMNSFIVLAMVFSFSKYIFHNLLMNYSTTNVQLLVIISIWPFSLSSKLINAIEPGLIKKEAITTKFTETKKKFQMLENARVWNKRNYHSP